VCVFLITAAPRRHTSANCQIGGEKGDGGRGGGGVTGEHIRCCAGERAKEKSPGQSSFDDNRIGQTTPLEPTEELKTVGRFLRRKPGEGTRVETDQHEGERKGGYRP